MIKLKLSSDFFKRPTTHDIDTQYNNEYNPTKTKDFKLKKKILVNEEAPDRVEEKRFNIETRELDFTKKNRFKFIKPPPQKVFTFQQTDTLPPESNKQKSIETSRANKEDDKRLTIETRTLDFARKNRFKFIKTSPLKAFTFQKLDSLPFGNFGQGNNEATEGDKVEDTEKRELAGKPEMSKKESSKQEAFEDCVICYGRKADVICMPCGHGGACKECVLRICIKEAVCFICKKPVDNLLQVDTSRKIGNLVIVLSSIPIAETDQ